jgi:hypothetical protein
MSTKIIVTNMSTMQAKYGSGWNTIEAALKRLIQADKGRGLETQIVAIDDAKTMKDLQGQPVSSARDYKQNKAAIDKVYQARQPDYLMLLGAADVIPHQDLRNPLYSEDDPDQFAWGDIPYACEAPYSNDLKNFVGPTRVLGRLPDLTASSDPNYLSGLLSAAAKWKSFSKNEYISSFAISVKIWNESTVLSLENVFGTAANLKLSPPDGPAWSGGELGRRSHFINCHGALSTPHFFGQSGTSYPKAHSAALVAGKITAGTVIAAECCYGAELYNPAQAEDHQMGIANTYLEGGAYGFFGSSTIAYGPPSGNGDADLMCQYFFESVLGGASLGRATLEARHQFAKSAPELDPVDLKTMAQFNLLGDPSIQPVTLQATHEALALIKSIRAGKAKMSPEVFERRSRRRQLFAEGALLSETKAVASLERSDEVSAATIRIMKGLAKEAGMPSVRIMSFKIERPTLRTKSIYRALTDSFAKPAAFHVAFSRLGSDRDPITNTALLIATELDGKIVAVKKLLSR